MRNVQRGISAMFLVIAILVITVALTAGYFTFYLDLKKTKQAASEINSFEECAKLYPVMESYPEQCNTPDGKHFIHQLSNEDKGRLDPSALPAPSTFPAEVDGQVWNDVRQIVVLVNLFYAKYQRLPKSINEVLGDPEWSYFKLRDNPINSEPYLYKIKADNKSFEVSGMQSNGVLYKEETKVN